MRIRDIVHVSGRSLRIGLDRSDGEAMVIHLSDPNDPSSCLKLDLYAAELLAGFLLSARLAASGDLAEERSGGPLACRLRLVPGDAIELGQRGRHLFLPRILWDRLYAELMLALAHGRHLRDAPLLPDSPLTLRARLLH